MTPAAASVVGVSFVAALLAAAVSYQVNRYGFAKAQMQAVVFLGPLVEETAKAGGIFLASYAGGGLTFALILLTHVWFGIIEASYELSARARRHARHVSRGRRGSAGKALTRRGSSPGTAYVAPFLSVIAHTGFGAAAYAVMQAVGRAQAGQAEDVPAVLLVYGALAGTAVHLLWNCSVAAYALRHNR